MNHRIQINWQRNGSPLGRPGMCRRTRSLQVAWEARAPPSGEGHHSSRRHRNNNARVAASWRPSHGR